MVSCRRGGNNPKLLSNEAASSIRSWLEEDNTLTLKKLAQKVWEQYHVRVSASTVAREIRGFHKALQRRRWDSQTSEPISVQLNAKKKSLSAKENGVDESTGQITIKHEYDTFSDDDVQFNDQIDIGETTITESCEVEQESHTADTLASKTEYTYLPNSSSVETSNNSGIKTVAANGNSIFNEVSNNSTAAKTICTHCSCIDKLLSEQKTMIKQFFTNQQTIMNKIQETQQTLMSKLEFIEGSLKNERNKE
uniref:Uncharacterized protein n=1 Tax=Anopheles epiroticus TaxID=199890 RepID=A0A182P6A6_9DIPT